MREAVQCVESLSYCTNPQFSCKIFTIAYFCFHEREVFFIQFLPDFPLPGVVEDADTGKGLKGIYVGVEEINYYVTTSDRGEFWRLLLPGNYTLIAKGYG